eukprot:TRINITY_DN5090_c0_g1_i3.p1 TRINITY_DN5090_c0_g1~~TRINITY_DN5090_c0_g1_i3.p1  ORF type:complete len:319 (-),score=58.44 TRINITY_DN5090_c0_g1_i3:41-976(-)
MARCILFVTCMYAMLASAMGTSRPVIGIMTQPTAGSPLTVHGTSFINSDYVKWLESAGARVVPVPYNAPESQLDAIFKNINGLLYAGGADIINHTLYYNASLYMYSKAIKSNDAGDVFPLWGTCLGFELLSMMAGGGNISILTHFDAENISLPVTFYPGARDSRMLGNLSKQLYDDMEKQPITENYHHFGVSPENFEAYKVTSMFKALSTSVDRAGNPFVSMMEGHTYPFFSTQWHPERSLYEWLPSEAVNHSYQIVQISNYIVEFFVEQTRASTHAYPSYAAEQAAVIENYNPYFTGLQDIDTQMYIFNF